MKIDKKTLMQSIDFNTANFEKHINTALNKNYSLVWVELSQTKTGESFAHCMFGTCGLFGDLMHLLIVYQADGLQHVAMLALDKYTTDDLVDCYNRGKKSFVNGIFCIDMDERDLDKFYCCNHLCSPDYKKAYKDNLETMRKAGMV
jgi:hypothetical protein